MSLKINLYRYLFSETVLPESVVEIDRTPLESSPVSKEGGGKDSTGNIGCLSAIFI